MAVTVTPETFTMVEFDAPTIVAVVERLIPVVGLPADVDLRVDIDERVPLGRAVVASVDPLVLEIEGGALEDPKRPRRLSEDSTADIVGRLLFRARDQRDPEFGTVPDPGDLSLALATAWDVYATGRLVAGGYRSQRQRWLYAFRNRHGFTDAADAAFDRLWSPSDPLVWADIERISDAARAPVSAP